MFFFFFFLTSLSGGPDPSHNEKVSGVLPIWDLFATARSSMFY